jgi:hypothetical protein
MQQQRIIYITCGQFSYESMLLERGESVLKRKRYRDFKLKEIFSHSFKIV